jgi:hypothetical protein
MWDISFYLEIIIDRYPFIVIYAYYKYASIIVYTNTTARGTHRRKERDEIDFQATTFLIMQFMFLVCIIPKLSWHS